VLGSSKWSFSLMFPCQNPVCLSPPIHATCHAHLILLDLITCVIFGEEYRSLNSSLCTLLLCNVIPLSPKYTPQHPILKYPRPMFLSQSEQPSVTPIQNKGKIMGDRTLVKKSQCNRLVVRMVIKSIFHWQCRSHLILLFKGSLLSVLTDKAAKVLLYMPCRHRVGAEVELYSFLTLALDGVGF
jgi:hypothetical protein